ncbi:uncharacterized protein [Spinacia oleracea]|uniref:Vacuolar protein sorting-associated protein 13 VPS13 adaptor binding domain-containing protein n=1 Tax=Spinacia oleracea TaxID=3562 RepID=A0ABM3QQY1_SPIOL|nr:uncharacterized protein LOC110800695 [Spinacia oleracea]
MIIYFTLYYALKYSLNLIGSVNGKDRLIVTPTVNERLKKDDVGMYRKLVAGSSWRKQQISNNSISEAAYQRSSCETDLLLLLICCCRSVVSRSKPATYHINMCTTNGQYGVRLLRDEVHVRYSHKISKSLRYGTLPREAVWTENLTPWLKLLPCRDKAGLAELMDRPSMYRGFYHSQRLHLVSSGFDSNSVDLEIELEQTLTVVLQPSTQRWATSYSTGSAMQPSWSLSTIFGREINKKKCILAKSSNVYLQLDRGLVSEMKKKGFLPDFATSDISITNPAFELSPSPEKMIREVDNLNNVESSILYVFVIEKYVDAKPFDLVLTWKLPVVWSCSQAPLLTNRFLMGSGNERGAIVISLKSINHHQSLVGTGAYGEKCNLHINVFQVIPWYVKVYYHTLRIYINGQVQPAANVTRKMRVSPSYL